MNTTPSPSVLKSLRLLIPQRSCEAHEHLRIAEAQACRLVEQMHRIDPTCDGISLRHIDGLPRLRVVHDQLPVSGLSYWNGREWIIALNHADSLARQRFTLLHEFKHVVDHGATSNLYQDATSRGRTTTAHQHAEQAADYFAGCALVPKRDLKRAWGNRIQRVADLADHFGVSEAAIEVRLKQTGLDRAFDPEPSLIRARCAQPIRAERTQPQRFRARQTSHIRRSYA